MCLSLCESLVVVCIYLRESGLTLAIAKGSQADSFPPLSSTAELAGDLAQNNYSVSPFTHLNHTYCIYLAHRGINRLN